MKNKEPKIIEEIDLSTPESLASEMYRELKKANEFKNTLLVWLCAIILALVLALGIVSGYHIYMWSQFDTVVVDTGEGGGNANYVQGDNQGGIFNNGESSGQEEEAGQGQKQGDADKT